MSSRLYYIITITNRVMGSKHFLDFYRAFGAPVVFSALGRGTASDDILSYLGLEATEKTVLFSVVTPQVKDVLMRELVDTMHIDRPGSGIAVCLHLSSVGGMSAMNYLISGGADVQPDLTVKEEELMHDSGYELVVAIANGGYSDMVMEAASAAGRRAARCCTPRHRCGQRQQVLRHGHYRGAGDDPAGDGGGPSRAAIMQAIMEKAGAQSEAQSVVFSVKLDDVAGLYSREN